MIWRMRHLIKPTDLNAANTLFGGQLMQWIDEAAAIYVMCQLDTKNVVTKTASFNFTAPARQGDVIEIGIEATEFKTTAIILHVVARNKDTKQVICDIPDMVFVSVDPTTGLKTPHGKTAIKELNED